MCATSLRRPALIITAGREFKASVSVLVGVVDSPVGSSARESEKEGCRATCTGTYLITVRGGFA